MNPNRPSKLDKKHPQTTRDAMEETKDVSTRYMEPNRDRAIGHADRTGRHFDEDATAPDEGSEASQEHEAD